MVVGISSKAMPIGITLPRGYVERWNREYAGEEAANTYSSIEVALTGRDAVAPFAGWLRDELDLTLADQQGERFATAIFIITSLFVLISLIIVTISAINIAHSFFLQVSERKRELGVLRAIGATRADIRMLVLAEAGLVGVIGGVLGIASAWIGGALVDVAAARWLPPFPFKPESFFLFEWWIVAGGLGCAVLFAVLGGFFPARRAARMAPARALAQD
jgi:putative ABC transport system permease protein